MLPAFTYNLRLEYGKEKIEVLFTQKLCTKKKKKILESMQQLPATVSSSASTEKSLPISLTASVYTGGYISNVAHLNTRLKLSYTLPFPWVNMTSSSDKLILCYLTHRPPSNFSEVMNTIQVDKELKWTLAVFSSSVETERCSMLASLPHEMRCVDDVVRLLHKLNVGKLCVGNPDQQFVCLDFSGWLVKYVAGYLKFM